MSPGTPGAVYAHNGHLYRQVLRMEKKVWWVAREFGPKLASEQYRIWRQDPDKPNPRKSFGELVSHVEMSEQGREAS